jgi:hypothetical protein
MPEHSGSSAMQRWSSQQDTPFGVSKQQAAILILSSHVNKKFAEATRHLFVNIPGGLGADYWP